MEVPANVNILLAKYEAAMISSPTFNMGFLGRCGHSADLTLWFQPFAAAK